MTTTLLIVNLVITIAIILVLILKFEQNPVISMFIGALFMGIASKLGFSPTIGAIVSGFGGTMQGIGISVGFGIILGQLLASTGGVQSIARGIINSFGKERSHNAMGLTGFIVSIPVFYDVGYVILMPIAKSLSRQSNKTIAYYITALVAGLGIAHTFVPPTPGPLAGAELLGVEVGTILFFGLVIGLPSFFLATFIYNKAFLSRENFWNDECIDPEFEKNQKEIEELENKHIVDEKTLPSFGLAILPILIPIVLILAGTASNVLMSEVPDFIVFISNKNVAMFCGLLASLFIASSRLTKKETSESINIAMGQAGTVLLITGMGGGLGSVLGAVGIGDAMLAVIETANIHPLLFGWLVAALLKAAQGSGTVAMITTAGLLAPTVAGLNVSPALLALAVFSGTLATAHVNDSAFWITSKIAGLTTVGGLKSYTLMCSLVSIVSIILVFILNIFV